jgi:hypothetical protein
MAEGNPRVALLACAFTLLFASDAFGAPGDSSASIAPRIGREHLPPLSGHGKRKVKTPALIVDRSRDPTWVRDYLRMVFLSDPSLVPTTPAGPNSIREFFTASNFYEPPIPLVDVASYVGLGVQEDQNLAVFQCHPPDPNVAVLASWPHVMTLLQDDLSSQYSCPPTTTSPENEVFCIAAAYYDAPEPTVTQTLAHTYRIAKKLFPEGADVLSPLAGKSCARWQRLGLRTPGKA